MLQPIQLGYFLSIFRTPVHNITTNWENMAEIIDCFHEHSIQVKDHWAQWVKMPFVGVAEQLEHYYHKIKGVAIKMRNNIKVLLDDLSFTQVRLSGLANVCSDVLKNLCQEYMMSKIQVTKIM